MSRILAMLLLGSIGLAWSGPSQAQISVCNFVALTTTTQTDVANGTVSFQLQAQGACPPSVAISLAVDTAGDTTGGAVVVPPAITTITSGTPYTFQVTLGPTSGGTGVVDATCTAGCTGVPVIQFSFATANDIDWTPVPAGLAVSSSQLTPFNFGTNLVINGAPSSAITTTFTNVTTTANYGTVTPDGAGDANSGPQTIATASTYTLRATPNCPVAFILQGCSALTPIDFTLTVEPVSVTRISAATETIVSGDNVTVTARYGSPNFPQPDGQTLTWSVTQPAGGDGSITPSPIAGGAGETQGLFTATVPGVYTVTAMTTCTFCTPNSTTFSITVTALPFNLTAVTPNPATGVDGDPFGFTVALDQGGTPVVGGTIQWSSVAPFSPAGSSSITDGLGEATATFTPAAAGSFTGAVTALYDPDGIPANGDEVSVSFDANVAANLTLAINGGNGQTTPVNTTYGSVLSVIAEDSGAAAAGVGIDWLVTGGTATIVDSGATDSLGEAHLSVTPTSVGTITITATRQDDATATVTFTLTSTAPFNITRASANPAIGAIGAPLTFTVAVDQGGAPVVGDGVQWTANAPFSPASAVDTTDAAGESSATFTPSAGGTFTNVVTANYDPDGVPANGDEVSVSFDANVIVSTLAISDGDGQSGTVGIAYPIGLEVLAEDSGAPAANVTINWLVTGGTATIAPNGPTDAAGLATAIVTPTSAGTITISATRQDAPGATVTFTLTAAAVVKTLTSVSPNPASGNIGVPIDFTVLLEQGGVPVNAAAISWSSTAPFAPAAVAGTTDAAGESTATFTPSAAGTFVGAVTALYDGDGVPASGDELTVVFDVGVAAAAYALAPTSANPAPGTVGSPMTVSVELTQGGTPVPGASIQWSAGSPFAPASSSSTTDASGQASTSFTASAAGAFPAAITASHDPDGVPASGDEVTFAFDANIAAVATLAITGGDGQSALPNAVFALPLEVLAEDSGVAAAGIGILWTVVGDATVAPSGPTDPTGAASATVTAGATAGAVAVTATRQDDPSVSVTFNLTVSALGTLSVVSGDDQTLQAGITSLPMRVELKDAGGVPVAGATIDWAASAGTLGSATSVTDAAGIASNTLTTAAAGKVQVTASSPLAAASAVFALNGGLSNLAGLDPVQTEVVDAIDTLCPALAAMPTLTPNQADLLARCRELTDAGGLDPNAAIEAIDELMTDVARAQGNSAFVALQAQFQNLKTRIAALRSGTQGTNFGGLAVNTPTGPISLETLSSAFNAAEEPTTEVGTDFSRWGFFAAGTIGRGEADEGQIDPAYDYDIEGLTAGFDYRHGDKWIFGGAFGYTSQDTDLPSGQGSIDTSGWTLSAYSTYYTPDSWYADGVITLGSNDYDMVRHIEYTVPLVGGGTSTIAQTARADEGGDLLQSAFTVGRDFNRGALGIGPYARLLYTRVDFDAIEEETVAGLPGSGLGLRVEERELTSVATVIGGKLTYTYSTDWGVLMPHAQLEWEHEFKDDPQSIEARFLNDPTGTGMLVRGDPLDTDYFRIGLGMSMVLTRGRSGFVYYEHLLGRDGTSQWNLALGLRLEF